MSERGKCPHCGGESDGMTYYSCPLQTSCKDCGKLWSFGPGIQILDGKQGKKKRPGMYFKFCLVNDIETWHLREPAFGRYKEMTDTLCSLSPKLDIKHDLTYDFIMNLDHVCLNCQNKFIEMTT